MLGLALDWTALRTAVLNDHRVVVPYGGTTKPIEELETHLPLSALRYELREDLARRRQMTRLLWSVRKFTFLNSPSQHTMDTFYKAKK